MITEEGTDWLIVGGDLSFDDSPNTTALLTAYTDARADFEDDPLPDPRTDDRRGYWADVEGDRWGSLLWLLERATLTSHDLGRAQVYVSDAFQWWVRDGLVQSVAVRVQRFGPASNGRLEIEVILIRGSAKQWPEMFATFESGTYVHPRPNVELRLLSA